MATWKRILVEDDVAGDGIIAVTSSSSALHTVSLGDPDGLTELTSPVIDLNGTDDDKMLIWDESESEWKWISVNNFPGTNLGNSNLVQTDTTRTFDVAYNGVLEFRLNGGDVTGNGAPRLRLSYDTSSIPEAIAGLPRAVIELNTPSNLRQTRAFLISIDEANAGASNDSSFSGSLGINTSGATYYTSSPGGIVKLDAYSNIAALIDDTEGSETYAWSADKVRYVNIELGSTGFVTPALNWDEGTTSAAHAQQNFGGYINFDVLKPIQAYPYYQPNTQLRVDTVGVRINDADTDESSYYLPTNRGSVGQILHTDGLGGTYWEENIPSTFYNSSYGFINSELQSYLTYVSTTAFQQIQLNLAQTTTNGVDTTEGYNISISTVDTVNADSVTFSGLDETMDNFSVTISGTIEWITQSSASVQVYCEAVESDADSNTQSLFNSQLDTYKQLILPQTAYQASSGGSAPIGGTSASFTYTVPQIGQINGEPVEEIEFKLYVQRIFGTGSHYFRLSELNISINN